MKNRQNYIPNIKSQAIPLLDNVESQLDNSFQYAYFEKSDKKIANYWHIHPEIELVYLEDGSGKRQVGEHISYFSSGELILIGSNLAHNGYADRLFNKEKECVIQMREKLLDTSFKHIPEMGHIHFLLMRAKKGISFQGNIKRLVGERMKDMLFMTPFERLIQLLRILDKLAKWEEYELLNIETPVIVVNRHDSERLNTIFDYVRQNFQQEIPLADVASHINMTVPAFCRYFKKHTNLTFTQYVNKVRIVHACKLLNEETMSIAEVSFECGFNNFSHFNRHFKKITGKSPSQYRKDLDPFHL